MPSLMNILLPKTIPKSIKQRNNTFLDLHKCNIIRNVQQNKITVFFPSLGHMNAQRVRRVGRQHQATSKRQRYVLAAFSQHGHGRTVLDVVQRHAVRRHNPIVHPVVRDEGERKKKIGRRISVGIHTRVLRVKKTNIYIFYISFPSAGPDFNTSDTAIEGSPLAKCGLSRPPLTAMPNP